ncbi:MAG: hypothetical protein ACKV2Q_20480 [Planctomycetaceae bacterium]
MTEVSLESERTRVNEPIGQPSCCPTARHLLSHDPDGIEIQTYYAIIACLPINLWTGR